MNNEMKMKTQFEDFITQQRSLDKTYETEFRFGNFFNKHFTPNVTIETFMRMQNFIKSFARFERTEYSTVTFFDKNIRMVEYFTPPQWSVFANRDECEITNIVYHRKEKIKKFDNYDYGVRLCHSREIPYTSELPKEELSLKNRKRFVYSWKNTEIHLTISGQTDFDLNYDVEIEIPFMTTEDYSKFMDFFTGSFLKCLQNTNKLFTNKFKYDTLRDYQSLVKTKKFIAPKVHSLRYSKINFNETYVVSDKLDGERKLLYFRKGNIIVFSNKGDLWILNDKPLNKKFKIYENTILDTEFFNGIFYVFDTLYFKGENKVNTSPLNERISIYREILDTLQDNNVIPKPYFSGENLYETVVSRLDYQSGKKNFDGVILTPERYTNGTVSLKFKDTFTNTIDFKIKKVNFSQEEDIWELYCYNTDDNGNNTDTLFIYTEYAIDGTIKVPITVSLNYPNNCVVEFKFDKILRTFVPLKQRLDKTYGNYISIAYDNFEMDMHPFQLSWLKKQNLPLFDQYFFNYKRINHYAKRQIIQTYKNKGNLLLLSCYKGEDIYKIIDNSIRNVTAITEDVEFCQQRYEKNIHDTNKNFIFTFETKIPKEEKFDMIFNFDENQKYTDSYIKEISSLLNTGGVLIIRTVNDTFLKTVNFNLTTKFFTTHLVKKGQFCISSDLLEPNECMYTFVDTDKLFEKFVKKGLKIQTESIKGFDYYNTWSLNENFLSNPEILYDNIFKYTIFIKE